MSFFVTRIYNTHTAARYNGPGRKMTPLASLNVEPITPTASFNLEPDVYGVPISGASETKDVKTMPIRKSIINALTPNKKEF